MNIVLVTGASSGLGVEFLKLIDKRNTFGGRNIDELWIIARRKDRLEHLTGELIHKSRIFALDLSVRSSFSFIKESVASFSAEILLLVNCAGFGRFGMVSDMNTDDLGNMISVNCTAATIMTGELIPYMRKGSRIINICSTAAFQPLPAIAVYAATKSYLYSYTRALRFELLHSGIGVTAVCPYWMLDTEFIQKAEHYDGEKKMILRHYFLSTRASAVARRALRGAALNLPVVTPDFFSFIHRFLGKLIPDELLMWGWSFFRRI
ncbi:MAG: SDR family NAD(P)-dependent oxidoreductase [Treponema sp.]|jgi:short-subunit dehydrogenase|nr:SDR family NAD(P)-dependent oxidoreductase [Treponema sp.]